MRPSSFPEPSTDDFPMMSEYEEVGFREGCPLGTVPIRRIPKEDKRRAKAFLKTYSEQLAKDSMQPLEEPGAYFVILFTNQFISYQICMVLDQY